MRKFFLFFVFINLSFFGISQNILNNGGMEAWTSGFPDSWTTIEEGIIVSQASTPLHGGDFSAEVQLTTAAQANTDFYQMLDVTAGTTYSVSVWIYHTDNMAKARLNIDGFRNYSNNDLVNQWQEVVYTYEATESKTIEVGLRFYDQEGFESSSTMYVDDFMMIANIPQGNQSPVITNITQTPTFVTENDDVTVTAEVIDDSELVSVVLNWGVASNQLNQEVLMTVADDEIYSGVIPAQSLNTTVYYAITATDDNNSSTTSSEMQYTVQEDNPTPVDVNAWINEIHYDNAGADQDEMVEVVIENASHYDLSEFLVVLYNGGNGQSYQSETVDNFVEGDTTDGFTFFTWMPSSMQNGPDGLALAYHGELIQFLSYEGVFEATNGVASGQISVDIDVEETGTTAIGASLQLSGGGLTYDMFTWSAPTTATAGMLNHSQVFSGEDPNSAPVIENITQTPENVTDEDVVTISADVTDDGEVVSVVLNWGTATGILPNQINMFLTNGHTYSGTIPAQASNTSVYYAITATDDNNSSTTSTEMSYEVEESIVVTPTTTLIISQYYEGTASNKWIELTNLGTENIDLSHYYLTLWSNTDTPSGEGGGGNVIGGVIEGGQTILIRKSNTVAPDYAMNNPATMVNSGTNFNGNDVVAITFGDKQWENRVDCIYGAGFWGKDKSFVRKGTVTNGNTAMSVLDGTGEWVEFTIDEVDNAMDTQSAYLGVHVLGEVLVPGISVTPQNHDFGMVEVGGNATQIFTVMNTGTAPLILSDIVLSGNAAFTTNGVSGTVAIGEGYTFEVIFTPTSTGIASAVMTIVNNSPTPEVEVSLTGIGKETQVIPEEAVWQGTENDDWFTAGNWDVNAVPGDVTVVTIPSNQSVYPTLVASAMCKKIIFEQGATLLGFEQLTVMEDAIIHQSLTGGINQSKDHPDAVYHHVAAPIFNPTAGTVFPLSSYLRRYNETIQSWENLLADDVMEVGKGYSLWMPEGDEDITYQGSLNQEEVVFNGLTLTDEVDNYSGWHLLGNPYPAAINANSLMFPMEMQHGVSVWSNANGGYIAWNGSTGDLTDGVIPVGQGFFVKVNQNNVNFVISPDACVHHDMEVYKSNDVEVMAINIKNDDNLYNETAFITFASNGDNGYDRFDVMKLDGLIEAPSLYTMIEDKRCNINSRYSAEDMPLYFITNVDGNFTLQITDFELSDEVTIEDTFTGAIIPAKTNATYQFSANANDDMARFVIHFKGFVDIEEDKELDVSVYSDNQQVVVRNQTGEEALIMLYNISGQLIEVVRAANVETRMNVGIRGVYFVTVKNSKFLQTEKVIIKN